MSKNKTFFLLLTMYFGNNFHGIITKVLLIFERTLTIFFVQKLPLKSKRNHTLSKKFWVKKKDINA